MKKRGGLKRRQNIRKPGKRLLIVCEGARTEPLYFEAFRRDLRTILINIEIEGTGKNTNSLLEEVVEIKKLAIKEKEPYDEIWAVFDRNSFPAVNFNKAFDIARKNRIHIAYSNEAFEIWFLLHFDYIVSALSRRQYQNKLTDRLGFRYQKNSNSIYSHLISRQLNAVRNAERLLSTYTPPNPATNNPSTTVHLLVNELNKYRK